MTDIDLRHLTRRERDLMRILDAFHVLAEADPIDPTVPGSCWVATRNLGGHADPAQRRALFPPEQSVPGVPRTSARWLMMKLHGPLGDRLVLHRCGTSACLRPDHLYVGDQHANMLDRVRHARLRRGAA